MATKSIVRTVKAAVTQDNKARAKAKDATAKAAKNGTLDSFTNFAHKLGIGADNALSTASYGFNPITRNRVHLEWIHRGSWIGGIAVDVVADDMTRAGIEMKTKMKPEDITAIEESATTLKIWQALNDLIKWSRLYGGAIAVMLIDGHDMATPLRLNTIREGQFRGLCVLDRWMVDPSLSDLITEFGPDLGLPKFYRVTGSAPALHGQTIHHSRCIRLSGIRLPYWQRLVENLWGISVLERLYDRLVAFDSASTGAAQLVYKSYVRTYKIKELRNVIAAGGKAMEGLTNYVDMMRRFQGIEGMTLLDSEDEFEAHGHQAFSGLSDALAQFGQQLAGALQIPLVRLFGQSPAGFSTGDADLRTYYDGINHQQVSDLLVPVTKIYRLLAASKGIEVPEGFQLGFKSLWQLTDEQKATIAGTTTDTVIKAEEAGLVSKQTAMKELQQSSHITGVFSNIKDEDIEAAEEDIPPDAGLAMGGEEEAPGISKQDQ